MDSVKILTVVFVLWQISFAFAKSDIIFQSFTEMDIKDPTVRYNNIEVQKLSKKSVGLKGVVTYVKDLPMMTLIKADTFSKTKNGYVLSAGGSIQGIPFCGFYQSDQLVVPDLLQKSNYTKSCPTKKADYVVDGFLIDAQRALPNLPTGLYKTELSFLNMGKPIAGFITTYEIK